MLEEGERRERSLGTYAPRLSPSWATCGWLHIPLQRLHTMPLQRASTCLGSSSSSEEPPLLFLTWGWLVPAAPFLALQYSSCPHFVNSSLGDPSCVIQGECAV